MEMSLFSKLIPLTTLDDLTDILMCFFLGKFIREIYEYSQKSELSLPPNFGAYIRCWRMFIFIDF